jgi:hypothetical protein
MRTRAVVLVLVVVVVAALSPATLFALPTSLVIARDGRICARPSCVR